MSKSKKEEIEFILPTKNGNNVKIVMPSDRSLAAEKRKYAIISIVSFTVFMLAIAGACNLKTPFLEIILTVAGLDLLFVLYSIAIFFDVLDLQRYICIIKNNQIVFVDENTEFRPEKDIISYLEITYITSDGIVETRKLYTNGYICETKGYVNDFMEMINIDPVKRHCTHYIPVKVENVEGKNEKS